MFPLHDVLNLCNLEYLLIISRIETHLLIKPYSQFIAGILAFWFFLNMFIIPEVFLFIITSE